MFRLLTAAIVVLCAAPAYAEGVDFVFMAHEMPEAAAMLEGTVAFRVGDVAYFASSQNTYAVDTGRKKLRLTELDGHPAQSHHKSARSIELGNTGALVFLSDDRKRLKIVRFDAANETWAAVERPVGFVPRTHARVHDHIVFPQTTRSPAWYVYDIAAAKFERVDRPREATRCYGTTFADGHDAVVVGLDDDGKPCAVRFDPVKKVWSDLKSPPVVPGPRAVRAGTTTYLVGPLARTVSYQNAAWNEHGPAPDITPTAQLVATKRGILAWHVGKAGITAWSWKPGRKTWTTSREDVPVSVRSTVQLDDHRWFATARVAGQPAVLEVIHTPGLSDKARSANRADLGAQPDAQKDWKTASEEEKQEAIKQGLGAVERYVPPERDKQGKVTTKGAWVFALGEQLVVWPVTPKKCKRFLDRMIAQWPTSTVGTRWKTDRGNGFARAGKDVLYSPTGQCRDTAKCRGDFFSERVTPLSQVGPIFTFSTHKNESNCDKVDATEHWTSVDLRTAAPAALTAVIKESSILKALHKHKTFRKQLADAETLEAALAILRKTDPRAGLGYAFGSWRGATRQVQLRLEYHPESPDLVESINLWVEPKDEFLEVFEKAARMPGSYMSGS